MTADELVAYLDGECPSDQCDAIEQALEEDPSLRLRFAELVRQRLMLADICGSHAENNVSSATRPAASRRVRNSQRLSPHRRSIWWTAAAACLLLALGLAWWIPSTSVVDTPVAQVITAGEDVRRLPATDIHAIGERLTVGARLQSGERVLVPALTFAELRFDDGSRVTLSGDTSVRLGSATGERLFLERGVCSAVVTPQASGTTFAIGTDHGRATVIGTRFTLTVSHSTTALDVSEGHVRLSSPDARFSLEVPAGDGARIGKDGVLVRRPAPAVTPTLVPAPAPASIALTRTAGSSALLPADPWPGANVSTDNGRGIPREIIAVSDQPFRSAMRITTPDDLPEEPRHTGEYALRVRIPTIAPLQQGDAVLARLWLRSGGTTPAQARLVVEDRSPQPHRSLDAPLLAEATWQRIELPFHVVADAAAGTVEAQLWLGRKAQTVEVAGLELIRHDAVPLRAVVPDPTYSGRAMDAPWRTSARQQMVDLRTGRLHIQVEDATGQPVDRAQVDIAVIAPALRFGTAVVAERLLGDEPDDLRYREELRQRFTLAVPENALKWSERERDPTVSERAVEWLAGAGIPVRGHTLVWPHRAQLPADLRSAADDPQVHNQRLDQHLNRTVTAFRERLIAWDVVNDPYSADLLLTGNGRTEIARWFRAVHSIDPRTPRFLNLYGLFDHGGADLRRQEFYERLIRELLTDGVPLDGLGITCHQDRNLTPPARLEAILARFARFGLPIHVTEFEIDVDDEALQADYTRDALLVFAKEPAVQAILAWGFWAGDHHRPMAAMLRADWSPKPNGQVWDELTRGNWHATSALSDNQGHVQATLWRGTVSITVTHAGRHQRLTTQLMQADASVTVRLP